MNFSLGDTSLSIKVYEKTPIVRFTSSLTSYFNLSVISWYFLHPLLRLDWLTTYWLSLNWLNTNKKKDSINRSSISHDNVWEAQMRAMKNTPELMGLKSIEEITEEKQLEMSLKARM